MDAATTALHSPAYSAQGCLMARGCRREATAALRGDYRDFTAFDHTGTVESVVKNSRKQTYRCEFHDSYDDIDLAVLVACRMLS